MINKKTIDGEVTGMTKTAAQQLIETRRTIRTFSGEPIETKVLYDLLKTAHHAPFHNKVEPWNAYLFNGEGKHALLGALEPAFSEMAEPQREKVAGHIRNAAACIYVTAKAFETDKGNKDALLATAAFIQNLQLLCAEQNIGVVWRTGPLFDDARMKEMIGAEGETFVGLLQIGKFDEVDIPVKKKRQPLDHHLTIFE